MILLSNLNLPLNTEFSDLTDITAKELKLDKSKIKSCTLYRKSVDARHKTDIRFCCSVLVDVACNEEELVKKCKKARIYNKKQYLWKKPQIKPEIRPIVIGFGPAGMFAGLTLARAGMNPLIIERGCDVDTRTKDVEAFLSGGKLNAESNVQFGEGGAGTFSDGKLNTGIKDPRCRTVLECFHEAGAPESILIDAKPHIGTDILVTVVKNIRKKIISLGGEVRFSSHLDNMDITDGKITAIYVNGNKIPCNDIIVATGHSARDTFHMLKKNGAEMIRKPFAMGVRIEHLQSDINQALYGDFANNPALGAADYKLAVHLKNGRGVYTFCMCPGGEVINSSSEEQSVAVNGMSRSKRDGKNANSAVLVGINPEDIPGDDVLGGCYLQEQIEQAAYKESKGTVPITTVGQFVFGKPFKITKIKPTVKPKTRNCDFTKIFPSFITDSLKAGIKLFDSKIHGFSDESAILTAPETRSSSPVRIVRGADYTCKNIKGLYPCGEGAGYAGGIVSAAVDGMKTAEAVIEKYAN